MYRKPSLPDIYLKLQKRFGHQGWWPTTKNGSSQPQYYPDKPDRKLSRKEKFEICLGAILTQNTAWTNVVKALGHLQRDAITTPQQIISAPVIKLYAALRPTGYFRQKTKRLRHFCRYIIARYQGELKGLFTKPVNDVREELLSLNGIGPETADSMLLYAGGKPLFVVDAYTRRAAKRIGLFDTDDYDEIQKYFMNHLPHSAALFNDFHAQWVALGKEFCRTKPRCAGCPLRSICQYGRTPSPFPLPQGERVGVRGKGRAQ